MPSLHRISHTRLTLPWNSHFGGGGGGGGGKGGAMHTTFFSVSDSRWRLPEVTPDTGYENLAPVIRVSVRVEAQLTSFQWAAWS